MILDTSDILLPQLEEPVCCTSRFSDRGSENTSAEQRQSRQKIADLVGITTID